MAEVNPFTEDCATPPLLFGTGDLYLRAPGETDDTHAGNFKLINLTSEGEAFRYFPLGVESPAVLAVSTAYQLECQGDSFSMRNLSTLLNEVETSTATGPQLNFQTIREARLYRVTFRKGLQDGSICLNQTCNYLELIFWRAYVDVPALYNFDPISPSQHTFQIIAVPDSTSHPSQPFGHLQQVCPAVAS